MTKNLLLPSALVGCYLLLISSVFSAPTQLNSLKAVVNGEPITQLDLNEAVRTQVQMYLMKNKGMISAAQAEKDIKELEKNALNDLIDRKLILSEFKTMGGSIEEKFVDASVDRFVKGRYNGDREKFLEALADQGLTLNQFRDVQRDQIAVQALQRRYSEREGGGGMLSLPAERKAEYDRIKHEYATEGKLKLRMISIPKATSTSSPEDQRKLIEKIRNNILRGKSFASQAETYSKDSFASKGGYVGIVGRGQLNAQLTHIAYSMKTGRVSEIIDGGNAYRLLYVDGRVGQKVPSQSEIADEIEKRLAAKKRQKNMDGWLKKLRRDANIRIYD